MKSLHETNIDLDSRIAKVKRQFFTYRNGLVADVMRRAGSPHRMIFGLTLPQVSAIAATIGYDKELAGRLWADDDVRESKLLAPMLVDPTTFSIDEAVKWTATAMTTEVADIVALKLLRRMPKLNELVERLCDSDMSSLQRYAGLRASFGLAAIAPDKVKFIATTELNRSDDVTIPVASQIINQL